MSLGDPRRGVSRFDAWGISPKKRPCDRRRLQELTPKRKSRQRRSRVRRQPPIRNWAVDEFDCSKEVAGGFSRPKMNVRLGQGFFEEYPEILKAQRLSEKFVSAGFYGFGFDSTICRTGHHDDLGM